MDRCAFLRKAILTAGLFAIVPGALRAQEAAAEQTDLTGPAPGISTLHLERESLLRVDFPGHRSWGRVKKGAELEGRLSVPLYAGERVVAPAESRLRVTVNSVQRIRESIGFWRKTGRGIVRAFNPMETGHPAEYRVELRSAELFLPSGEAKPLDTAVLRASSVVMIQPRTKSLAATGSARAKNQASGILLLALRHEEEFSVQAEPNPASVTAATEHRVARAYLLNALRSSSNHEGDTFQAELAEPVRAGGRVFPPRSVVEGTVARSVAPRMLSRAGSLYLRVDRIVPVDGEPLRVGGSLSGAEATAQARFALDEEGALHGRKPGIVNGLVDLGYTYAVGKISDDVAETPIRAIGATMSDAAVANAARYVGLGTSLAFLLTRHGRDVYLPKYSLIEVDLGRVSEAPAAANLHRCEQSHTLVIENARRFARLTRHP